MPGVVTSLEKRRVIAGKALLNPHAAVPRVRDRREMRVKRPSQAANEARKWVFEVSILALAESMPRHADVAAEVALVRIEGRDRATFFGRKKLRQDGAAIVVEIAFERRPVIGCNPRVC